MTFPQRLKSIFKSNLNHYDMNIKVPSDGLELYQGLKEYIDYYNNQLCHHGIDHQIPANRYYQAA